MAHGSNYADYEWYSTEYGGAAIPATAFPSYASRASAIVDQITFGRVAKLAKDGALLDCVRDAVCAAAESLYEYKQAASREIKSESNDGYSVTYADAGTEQQAMSKAAMLIKTYLSNTGLLYRGAYQKPRKEPQEE